MEASRLTIKLVSRNPLVGGVYFNFLSRCLSSSTLSTADPLTECSKRTNGQSFIICKPGNLSDHIAGRNLGSNLLNKRHFSVNAETLQNTQLESDIAASDPAPGFQATSPLKNYAGPLLPGFSLPLSSSGLRAALSPPSSAGRLTLEMLGREMSNCLSHGRLEETVQLFEDWVKFPDLEGKPKVANLMAYNLLIHAKLRLGADPRNLLQLVKEMEMSGVKPNLLTYNFLLRAIFRQRESKMAEKVLERMEQSGVEAQPDGDSYNFVIVLCALDLRLDPAMKHLRAMYDRGFVPSKTTYNEVLLAAIRMLRTRVGVVIMKDLKKQKIIPQVQTMVELALAAAEVDDSECALLALRFVTDSEVGKSVRSIIMDEGDLQALLATSARSGDAALAGEVWTLLLNSLRSTKPPNPTSFLARIHACAVSGDLITAFTTVQELEAVYGDPKKGADREIFSPFSSLRPLVLACTRGGFAALDAAYYKLAEMQTKGQKVALSAVNCVIQGCSNIWDVDRAYQTFEAIGSTFGLLPNVHSCNSLLDVFGKTKMTAEVQQIFKYMQDEGVTPDHRTYSLLVDAHVVSRDVEGAMNALETMINAGHTPQRETPYKVWRRCKREGNADGAQKMNELLKSLGYRDTEIGAGKWRGVPQPQ